MNASPPIAADENDILRKICEDKRKRVEDLKRATPLAELNKAASKAPPLRGFAQTMRDKADRNGCAFIAEIKKASPSAGIIRPNFSPRELAQAYAKAGAACLSVLTDTPYFQGRDEHLTEARAACDLPVLRKDFMIDPWQVAQTRALGADCILLIIAALNDDEAATLHNAAQDYGLDILIETHNREEMERALTLPSGLIGINNRNLKTLKTTLDATEELARLVPSDRFLVSESGIKTPDDIAKLKACGAKGFLVGESLLKQPDPGEALRALMQL
ncbi:MAG: indole-3-glycerol phosphate synthase TrpC [Bdellovibrionales bacterium]